MKNLTSFRIKNPLYLLTLIMAYGSVSMLILSPTLLPLATHYGISAKAASGVITFAMLGYTFGPIIYGPIVKHYGKKNTVYIGVMISLVGIITCIVSFYQHNFSLMLVGRSLTSLGAVSGMVVTYAIVADYYSEAEAKKILSKVILLSFAVMPSLTIALSGYITEHFNWLACVYLLGLYALICAAIIHSLSEHYPAEKPKNAINFRIVIVSYLTLLKNKVYMGYVSLAGIAVAAIYIHAAKAPFIAANQIHLTPSKFGYYNILPYLGYVLSLYLSTKISTRLAYNYIIIFGVVMMGTGSLLIVFGLLFNHLSALVLFWAAFFIFCGSSPILPNSMVLATSIVHDKSFAASFASFFYMGLATCLTWLAGILPLRQSFAYPLAIICLIMLIFSVKTYCIDGKKPSKAKN